MTTINDVQKALDALVEQNTFTAAAADGIAKLREKVDEVVRLNTALTQQNQSLEKYNKDINAELATLPARHAACAARETAVALREKIAIDLQRTQAVAEAQAATVKECFALVFRNVEVRGSLFRSVGHVTPPASPGSYPMTISTSDTESSTTQTG